MATASFPLRPCPAWGYQTDSSLTDYDDSGDELEQTLPPPLKPAEPKPQPQGRATRKTTQKATEESRSVSRIEEVPLPPYNQSGPTIDSIQKWMEADLIELNPDYQRDVVWNDIKQMNLIDSLNHNYTVPNLVFRRWLSDGEYKRVCIDGKQRLTSIKRFIGGEIPYKDSLTKKKLWYKKTDSKQRRKLVSEEWKRKFLGKTLTIYEYEGITPNQERMIFQRVQLGTILTPAERLQAINGVCANFVRDIRQCICNTRVFSNFSEWGGNRGKDFQVLAQIAFLIKNGKAPASLPEPDKLSTFLEGGLPSIDRIRDVIQQSFHIFARLLSHKTYSKKLLEKPDISPVEFVMAVYLIAIYKNKYTDCELSDALRRMWESGRNKATGFKKANKSDSNKSYIEMRSLVDKLQSGRIPLESDNNSTPAAQVPLWQDPDVEPEEAERPPSKLGKRSRSQAMASDDDVPLSTLEVSKRPTSKKARLADKAEKELDSDDEMDDGAIVVKTIPVRLATTKSTARKPRGVGTTGAVKVCTAATKVKRLSAVKPRSELPPIPAQQPPTNPTRSILDTSNATKVDPNFASTSPPAPVPPSKPPAAEAKITTSAGDRLHRLIDRRAKRPNAPSATPPVPAASKSPSSTFTKSSTPSGELHDDVQRRHHQWQVRPPVRNLPPAAIASPSISSARLPPPPQPSQAAAPSPQPAVEHQRNARTSASASPAPAPPRTAVSSSVTNHGGIKAAELKKLKFLKKGSVSAVIPATMPSTTPSPSVATTGRGPALDEIVQHLSANTEPLAITPKSELPPSSFLRRIADSPVNAGVQQQQQQQQQRRQGSGIAPSTASSAVLRVPGSQAQAQAQAPLGPPLRPAAAAALVNLPPVPQHVQRRHT